MMKKFLLCLLLMTTSCIAVAEAKSNSEAWSYLTDTAIKEPWVVISVAPTQYIQCANEGEFIRCPFPVMVSFS